MKVLLINTNDNQGGAAIACRRLMKALETQGVDVKMLVFNKETDDDRIEEIAPSFAGRLKKKLFFLAERLQIFLNNGFSRKSLFAVSTASFGFDLANHPFVKEADIIHIHWINHGLASLNGLGKLLQMDKKIAWTMHDLWQATGICHYPGQCDRFLSDCGKCPLLKSADTDDLSSQTLARKKDIFCDAGIRFVGCSDWLTRQARQSVLGVGNTYSVIPNPIDTEMFSPGDRQEARVRLGLPVGKRLILFGAANAADKRKGLDYLIRATRYLTGMKEEVELVMCGKMKKMPDTPFGLSVHEMGYIADSAVMADLYRAADLFVTPSLEDNLPNMIMEAMACGTPCVGFHIGGIPEMISHQRTGYLAQYRSAEDLANGIRWVLSSPDMPGKKARSFVESHYTPKVVADQYLSVYRQLLA
ncbi:MAG: glycosyltransferase family 4 protein [Bacteroidales bacterium]